MADSTTSNLSMSTESIQVAAEDAGEVQITQITFMDPKLYEAAAYGNIHVLEQYDIHVQLTPKKNTVLHVAAQFDQADCVKWILQLPSPSLLQQTNLKGDTPLHLAAREGHLTVVRNLIDYAKTLGEGDTERGAAADCTVMLRMINKDKNTALHEAVRYHHPEVVKLLIQEDPEFTYGANAEGKTPLYIAAEWGFGDLVQMILDNCTSPAHGGMKGRTALHAAVILNDQVMTKKILEWKPALTKELDEDRWSPLHFAAYVGCHPIIVKQLLEKSDADVVYLGVKDKGIGNRTALHIAASRGHVEIVKLLVSRFPDCCEDVDDEGNNVLHLIMPKMLIFLTSGLSNVLWLRVRGLRNEKNVEGKTPLLLFHNSSSLSTGPLASMLAWKFATFVRSRFRKWSRHFRVSIRPLGSLEIKEDSDSSESKAIVQISEIQKSEIRKALESHLIVATIIATVTFAAGFTLPGGYIQDNGNDNTQGMAVLSLSHPTNSTKGKDRHMAIAVRSDFKIFVIADSLAMVASMCAIGNYFLAAYPNNSKKTLLLHLFYGYLLTMIAMVAMVFAFGEGLQAVLHHSGSLEDTTNFIYVLFPFFFMLPFSFGILLKLMLILCRHIVDESYRM